MPTSGREPRVDLIVLAPDVPEFRLMIEIKRRNVNRDAAMNQPDVARYLLPEVTEGRVASGSLA